MSEHPAPAEPYPGAITDTRRAAALLLHHIAGDADGVVAIINEAAEDERDGAEFWLVHSLMDLAVFCSPALQANTAVPMLQRAVERIAGREQS